MQQVEGFAAGERDYLKLEGDTGPLVYPAGFLYVYWALHAVTARGADVRTAQYIFLGLSRWPW
jgi:alpha-1,3-mannosyltransferase